MKWGQKETNGKEGKREKPMESAAQALVIPEDNLFDYQNCNLFDYRTETFTCYLNLNRYLPFVSKII